MHAVFNTRRFDYSKYRDMHVRFWQNSGLKFSWKWKFCRSAWYVLKIYVVMYTSYFGFVVKFDKFSNVTAQFHTYLKIDENIFTKATWFIQSKTKSHNLKLYIVDPSIPIHIQTHPHHIHRTTCVPLLSSSNYFESF